MDLRAILNPIDSDSQRPTSRNDDSQLTKHTSSNNSQGDPLAPNNESVSSVSTDVRNGKPSQTPEKPYHSSSNTTFQQNIKSTNSIDLRPIILSPSKGSVYTRRASASPTRVPILQSPARRRRLNDPPDVAHLSEETNINPFSIFNALLNYAELTLEVAKNLDVDDLISLYAISKDFHRLVNSRFTAMITAQWHGKASESGRTFIHRCYKNLCMRDPALRVNETRPNELRFVPSFRWLRMILFREAIVDDIMRSLAREGHRLPRRVTLIIKKIWFTMDISDNSRRVGLMHNVRFWSNKDLFMATMFFLKIDMRLTSPCTGNGELGLRKMLMGQRSLSTLAKVLRRDEMRTQLDLLRMIVRYSYEPRRHTEMSILGVDPTEIGKLQYEGWGAKDTKFIGVDDLVMREAIRRKLNLQNHYVDMMIYGYINKKTWQDVKTAIPAPAKNLESEDDSSEDEGGKLSLEKMRLFADDSDEDEADDNDVEEEEMDLNKYELNTKVRKKGQGAGKSKEDPGI